MTIVNCALTLIYIFAKVVGRGRNCMFVAMYIWYDTKKESTFFKAHYVHIEEIERVAICIVRVGGGRTLVFLSCPNIAHACDLLGMLRKCAARK